MGRGRGQEENREVIIRGMDDTEYKLIRGIVNTCEEPVDSR